MELVCKKCGTQLVVDESTGKANFYRDKHSKSGYMNVCKECDNSYQKAWREKIKALKATEVPVEAEATV